MIKPWKLKVARNISRVYSLLNPVNNKGYLILMYHSVSNDRKGTYVISKKLFNSHLQIMLENFKISELSLKNIVNKGAAITFDDGFVDNLEIAAPILESNSIPFTVFISSDNMFNNSSLYLSKNAIRDLASINGVTIGAHGKTHVPLTSCSDNDLENEIRGSKQDIEDIIGREVTCMSYPHGKSDSRVISCVKDSGYEFACGSRFGLNYNVPNIYDISRSEIWGSDDESVFSQKIRGDWDWLKWKN